MPFVMKPDEPIQADHRFIRATLKSLFGGKVQHIPEEYERVSQVFSKLGGSWEAVHKGSADHINRLKRVVKYAFENGYLTKSGEWAQKPKTEKEPARG